MIYSIIGKSDVPLLKYHIFLKNKTGSDGGNIPEFYDAIASMETVNPLYAFAVAYVIQRELNKPYNRIINPETIQDVETNSIEVQTLALVQYLKGMATTVQLNKQCATSLYTNLKEGGLLGSAPSILNLDGDLFIGRHYDSTKYHSKEEADEAEDSFPYWVIAVIKEIQESEELVVPKKNIQYHLPYFVQNISGERIPIYDIPSKELQTEIGSIPPTGIEPVVEIKFGYGKLATSKSAWVELDETKIVPIKHIESIDDELACDTGSLKIPNVPFKIKIKPNYLVSLGQGISNHYYADKNHEYNTEAELTVDEIFLNTYGVIDERFYIELNPEMIHLVLPEHRNEEKKTSSFDASNFKQYQTDSLESECSKKYNVCVIVPNEYAAIKMKNVIDSKTKYHPIEIRCKTNSSIHLHVYSTDDMDTAISVRKDLMRVGCKVGIYEYDDLDFGSH